MIPGAGIAADTALRQVAAVRVWLTCSACGCDIDCLPDDPRPSLIECVCPHCGVADIYPESRLHDETDGR